MFKEIKVNLLKKAGWNYKTNDETIMQRLENNIKKNGMIENIIVRKIKDGYEVVNGNHRLEVLKKLNFEDVMCYDLGEISLNQAKKIAIETNETKFDANEKKLLTMIEELKIEFEDLDLTVETQDLNYEDFEVYEDEEEFENTETFGDTEKAKDKITIPRFQRQNDATPEYHVRLANINLNIPKDIIDHDLKMFMDKFLYLDLQNEINKELLTKIKDIITPAVLNIYQTLKEKIDHEI